MNQSDVTERNKKLILRFMLNNYEGMTAQNLREFTDNENYIQTVMTFRNAFPDYNIYVEEMTAEGDNVIIHGILRGTHKGEIFSIPATNRKIELPMMVKYHIQNDKITNAWPMVDQLALFEQLGVINRPV
jgi:predicted ester cyclase